jgi:flagellar motor protein MotB
MRQPPYLNLTEAEPQTALWAGLLFILVALTMVGYVGRRLAEAPGALGATSSGSPEQTFALALQQAFAAESRQGTAGVKGGTGRVQLTLNTGPLFEQHTTELTAAGRDALGRLARALKGSAGAPVAQVQVEGHTERDGFAAPGYPRDNWELSSGRAVAALRLLSAASKLDPKVFSAHGYADTRAAAPSPPGVPKAPGGRLEINVLFSQSAARR